MHLILQMVTLNDNGPWAFEGKELNNKDLDSPVTQIERNTCLFKIPTLETTEFDTIALVSNVILSRSH